MTLKSLMNMRHSTFEFVQNSIPLVLIVGISMSCLMRMIALPPLFPSRPYQRNFKKPSFNDSHRCHLNFYLSIMMGGKTI